MEADRWRLRCSLQGDFIWSLCFTDLARLDRCARFGTKDPRGEGSGAPDRGKAALFDLGFDCDNGSEFLNHHLWPTLPGAQSRCSSPARGRITRTTCARGAKELDACALSARLRSAGKPRVVRSNQHAVSRRLGTVSHHFCPSTKLVEKRREGARQIKRYDAPKTPYQRLLQSDVLEKKERAALQQQHAAINPFVLKRQIEAGLKEIQRLVRAGNCSGDSVTLVPSLRSGARSTASPERRSKPNLTIKVA